MTTVSSSGRQVVPYIFPSFQGSQSQMYGRRLQLEISEESARLFKEFLDLMEDHPPRCYCCAQTSLSSSNNAPTEAQNYVLSSLRSTSFREAAGNTQAHMSNSPIANAPGTSHNGSQTHQTSNSVQSNASKSLQVFFAVQGLRWSLEVEPIILSNEPSDSAFFHILRAFHRIHRPALFHWLSPFRFKYCRCVKVRGDAADNL